MVSHTFFTIHGQISLISANAQAPPNDSILICVLVHRIGRTGRAGKKGVAHTFFQTKADKLRAGELVKVLRDAGQPVPEKMLSFDLSIRKKEHKLYGSFGPKDYNNVPMKQPSKIVFGDD